MLLLYNLVILSVRLFFNFIVKIWTWDEFCILNIFARLTLWLTILMSRPRVSQLQCCNIFCVWSITVPTYGTCWRICKKYRWTTCYIQHKKFFFKVKGMFCVIFIFLIDKLASMKGYTCNILKESSKQNNEIGPILPPFV